MVICHPDLKPNFRYLIKQHCAMLAKGRIIGVQFDRLFQDDLYLKNARNANTMAQKIKKVLLENGYRMFIDSPTNQIFPILEDTLIEELRKDYEFLAWSKYDATHTVIRLVCSWATKEEAVQEFCQKIEAYRE